MELHGAGIILLFLFVRNLRKENENSFTLQVLYSQDKHSRPSVVETKNTTLELSLPVNEDYVIQIKPFSEGGEGISSHQITIPRSEGDTFHKTYVALSVCLTFPNKLYLKKNKGAEGYKENICVGFATTCCFCL